VNRAGVHAWLDSYVAAWLSSGVIARMQLPALVRTGIDDSS
jgi:hypothetical protein